MARHKEFDRDTVLQKAIQVFAHHGYAGTSTDVLLQAMGISRQSMYDTFGDKHKLYLQALQHYSMENVALQIRALHAASSPLKGLAAVLEVIVSQSIAEREPKCLGISAICEFGRTDPEINMMTETVHKALLSALEQCLSAAQKAGEIGADIKPAAAAQFLTVNLIGLRVAARAGASAQSLREIAALALRNLR